MKTVICHFFNEQYMLPWWLNHHKRFFDHGIMVDYASTDRSVEIIKEICPTWEIIPSRNTDFIATDVDNEISDIEKSIKGWKCCLTATEHLLGNYNLLNDLDTPTQLLAPVIVMVDPVTSREQVDHNKPLFEQITTGIRVEDSIKEYYWRSLHNTSVKYNPGRHFKQESSYNYKFIVLKYFFAPMTEEMIARRLQIQTRIPQIDRYLNRGHHHHDCGRGLTKETILKKHDAKLRVSTDHAKLIEKFLTQDEAAL